MANRVKKRSKIDGIEAILFFGLRSNIRGEFNEDLLEEFDFNKLLS